VGGGHWDNRMAIVSINGGCYSHAPGSAVVIPGGGNGDHGGFANVITGGDDLCDHVRWALGS
jgi:hypothetical protein